jgi:hypothetical protein
MRRTDGYLLVIVEVKRSDTRNGGLVMPYLDKMTQNLKVLYGIRDSARCRFYY